jgi:outer membrane immunogenic protein
MKKLLVAGIAAAAFCGVPALAADLPTKAPVYRPAPVELFNWTGCYIGGNLGGAWKSFRSEDTDGFVQVNHTGSGFVGGGQIGCDYQFNNNWVIGIQGMWDGSAVRGSHNITLNTLESIGVNVNSFGTVAAELGYLINPTLKFYGKAGIGWIAEKVNWNCSDCVPPQDPSAASTRSGFDAGLGLAWMFQRNWDLFVEYDHMWLGTKTNTFSFTSTEGTVTIPQNIRQSFDKVLVGIDYRFSTGKAPVVAKY